MTAELKGLRDASGALRYTVLGVAIAGGLLLAGIPSKAAEKERQPGDDGAVTVEIKDSTGATLNRNQLQGTVIGRQVSLTASILPAGVQVTSHQWTIPGNRIKSYTQTRESAEKADILPADLQQQTVSCYWLEGASAHIVGYAAQVQGPTGPQCQPGTNHAGQLHWCR